MKHYVVLWSILSSLILLPNFNSEACYLRGYFFPPLEDSAPNLLSWDILTNDNSPVLPFLKKPAKSAKEGNLLEWRSYFNEEVELQALEDLIYKSNLAEITQIATKQMVPEGFENAGATTILKSKKAKGFFNYLVYAKHCETLTQKVKWDIPVAEEEKTQRRQLSEEGQQAYKKEKNEFLRLRYAYQILRLEHYNRNYDEVISLFDELVEPLWNTPSIMRYWALEHLAGAYSGIGDKAKANFYFAQVFWHAPSRRTVSHRSIKLMGETDWNAAKALCETDEEQAALYATRAYQQGGDKLAELEAIIPLAPNGGMAKVLAVDELYEIEAILLRSWFRTGYQMSYSRGNMVYSSEQRATRLKTVLDKLLAEKQLEEQAFWQTLHAYVLFLLDDTKGASIELAQVLNTDGLKEHVREQVEVFAAAMEASQMPVIGTEQELRLAKLMPQLRNVEKKNKREGDPSFLRAILHTKYNNQQDKAKAYLCHYGVTQLLLHPRSDYINALLDFLNQPGELNALEQFLLGEYSRAEWKEILHEIKGTLLLKDGQFAAAIKMFQSLPQAYFEAEPNDYDPNRYQRFVAVKNEFDLLRDIPTTIQKEVQGLPQYEKLRTPANKLDVAQALLSVEQAYRSQPDDWRYAYLLMAAWTELSNVGEAWRATDYFVRTNRKYSRRKTDEAEYGQPSELGAFALGNLDNHYERRIIRYATEAVNEAKQPELQAALYFELAEYLTLIPDAQSGQYLVNNLLKNNYRNTAYYQEVITQCSQFSK